jgi:hypothetical protein
MVMNIELIKSNSLDLFKIYIPNLFLYLEDVEIEKYIDNSIKMTLERDGEKSNANFLKSFFMLANEHKKNNENTIRNEFLYFNSLLGDFYKIIPSRKKFRGLLLSSIFDYNQNSILNAMSEIAVCIEQSKTNRFVAYERKISNGKYIDFEFSNIETGEITHVDVVSIHFNPKKYENREGFKSVILKRITDKFNSKTIELIDNEKCKIYIYPIIHYLELKIIKKNISFIKTIGNSKKYSFNSFTPMFFGSIEKSYKLLSIDEISRW